MKYIRSIALMSILASLGGCATAAGNGDFCSVASPIRPSVQDVLTDGTARQILAHDETGAKLCGWK